MLCKHCLRYVVTEANEFFSIEVHKTIALEATRASVHAAQKIVGAFKSFDAEREKKNNPFILRLKGADEKTILSKTAGIGLEILPIDHALRYHSLMTKPIW